MALFDKRATLTDNLFKNVHEQLTSGLLVNDISDHLPISVKLSKHRDNSLVGLNEPTRKLVRMETPERTEALKLDVANSKFQQTAVISYMLMLILSSSHVKKKKKKRKKNFIRNSHD